VFAETENAFVEGGVAGFQAGPIELFESLAGAAHHRQLACRDFCGSRRRELQSPKIKVWIDEGQTIGVTAGGRTDLADDADDGFAIAIGATKDQFLFRGKLVTGNDGGAVEADDDGGGGFGENRAIEIAADQEDGNFLRDAGSEAHNLLWQARGQRREESGII